ncbi:MAG: DEAD/DEAH box helicase family protein [Acidobacteria bacterium]|nr:DEAD/DEAH box helicase family protein [Acidobacteriota bacterium]NIM60178.1 DEAD/DEAH box helicase family protein [Acidobacteriota bacterium]NIO57847.1 DEAD/DEAH box helicase family protein [Acidobacteriota bacterium]NIQ28856.1 DEAD/DEAH box helicase family protein [Acidobacteriota bacterium]NIQ83314.1 DEAD/DEAH box helicase family protein [Acidobacteriota bacterium]
MSWEPGDRVVHRFNPELGPGLVRGVEGRTLVIDFSAGETLRLAQSTDALAPLTLPVGARVTLQPANETVTIAALPSAGVVRLTDGREVAETDLWPLHTGVSLFDKLAHGEIDNLERFSLRLDALHLAAIREADGLGSFLGGRIRLFPHQLHAAESATRTPLVRWLLADEVGLGKTVEACLILNHLLRTGRADRTLVVAPETLTVQWLGELWRKYHQVFVLLDDRRLVDVEKDYGPGFNPFDAHRRVVLGLQTLIDRPELTEQAVEAGIDLLIVDEAHHLRRPPGHPGDPAYRAVRPIADLGQHCLLLSATPLEDDAHGFFRLLQLLRPDEFPEDTDFEQRLADRVALPPCTSATRRVEIGGLPPREGGPVKLDDSRSMSDLERAVRAPSVQNALERKKKLRRIRHALASGAALEKICDPKESELLKLARAAQEHDPRLDWLAEMAPRWRAGGDKTLIFVAHRESLEAIKTAMSRRVQLRVGLFHEDLSPGKRDIEVAQFRLPTGPSMLISTECGGEGRNFEFCTRLVLFDLPWNPMVVEQRIGRLDRIGRTIPVEIVYFVPPDGLGAAIARLHESLGLFREPLGGLERELAHVEPVIEQLALEAEFSPSHERFNEVVAEAREAQGRIQAAAYHELHRNPYRAELGDGILARVPPDLEELTADVVLGAAEQLEMHVETLRGDARYAIELGTRARVESLPGIAAGASFIGTFDREEAVRDESIDFFASGHPLVEGILAHLEESPLGRVGLLHTRLPGGKAGLGLAGLYKEGPQFHAVVVDADGRRREDWERALMRRPLKSRRVRSDDVTSQPGWPALVRAMARHLEQHGQPVAIAALVIEG